MGRFAKVAKAEQFTKGKFFPWADAMYLVRILKCKHIEPRNGGSAFLAEVEMLEVFAFPDNPGVDPKTKQAVVQPTVGLAYTWYCDLTNDAGPGNMQAFVELNMSRYLDTPVVADDMSTEEFEEFCEMAVNEKEKDGPVNPLEGLECILETKAIFTAGSGDPFTVHIWTDPNAA